VILGVLPLGLKVGSRSCLWSGNGSLV